MTTTSVSQIRVRTQKQVFAELHRQMRVWNPDVPAAAERLDPTLKLLLDLFSHQIARLEGDVSRIWENATRTLVRAMVPECRRWPVPAATIMRCKPVDPVVDVDTNTRFYYREPRDDGRTFHFAPARDSQLLNATLQHAFLFHDGGVRDLSPESETAQRPAGGVPKQSRERRLMLGFGYEGVAKRFADSLLYLGADRKLGRMLRWANWRTIGPSDKKSAPFLPGRLVPIDSLFAKGRESLVDWGGLRTSAELFLPLADQFAAIPTEALAEWQPTPLSRELVNRLGNAAGSAGADPLWWIEVILPENARVEDFKNTLDLSFDCLVAINSESQTVYHHTGSKELLEVELGPNIEEILDIESVTDTDGREYLPQHEVSDDPDQRYYALEERDNTLVLWFDFAGQIDRPPDAVNVTIATTAGAAANGVEAGEITQMYENHPGLEEVTNVLPVFGGVPARSEEEVITEAHQRLRARDRAITFTDLSRWTNTFDPRFKSVSCGNGVQVLPTGVRRCIVVSATVDAEEFLSQEEMTFLSERLERFLKSRSSVNTHFTVKVSAR